MKPLCVGGGYQFETVNYCEIDPYASKAYSQIHGISEDFNLHDVRTVNPLLMNNVNLVTFGFPCQDISVAGKQKGFEHDGERTRSGLFFEALRIIEFLQPEYAICENVKALTSKKFEKEYLTVLNELSQAGYNNYVEILNAKDFGVPQNRERVFIVSVRKDIDDHNFLFPKPKKLLLRLKDVLEPVVDEKFYLNNEKADKLIETLLKTYTPTDSAPEKKIKPLGHLGVGRQKGWVFDSNGISRCLAATDYKDPTKIVVDDNDSEEIKIKRLGNLYDENAGGARAGNVYDQDGLSPTLQTSQGENRQPLIVIGNQELPAIAASRGRNPENPGDRTFGCPTEQRLELNTQGLSNTLTLVQKDNYVVEPVNQYDDGTARTIKSQYYKNSIANFDKTGTYGATGVCKIDNHGIKIRKLTPRECWRLMGFSDEDFDKVKGISNTQLYKMAGNSIVVNVLEAIFKQLFKENHK